MLAFLRALHEKLKETYSPDEYVTQYRVPLKNGEVRVFPLLELNDPANDPMISSLITLRYLQSIGAGAYKFLQKLIDICILYDNSNSALDMYIYAIKDAHIRTKSNLSTNSLNHTKYPAYSSEFDQLHTEFVTDCETASSKFLPLHKFIPMSEEDEKLLHKWVEDIVTYKIKYYEILKRAERSIKKIALDFSVYVSRTEPTTAQFKVFLDDIFENVIFESDLKDIHIYESQITPSMIAFFQQNVKSITRLSLSRFKFNLDPLRENGTLATQLFDTLLKMENLQKLILTTYYDRNFWKNVFDRLIRDTPLDNLERFSAVGTNCYINDIAPAIKSNSSIHFLYIDLLRYENFNNIEESRREMDVLIDAFMSSEIDEFEFGNFSDIDLNSQARLRKAIEIRIGAVKAPSAKRDKNECHLCGVKLLV